jgi:hypothetical protein
MVALVVVVLVALLTPHCSHPIFTKMIALHRIAELDVSAASGLVRVGDSLCVVADDELFLSIYDADGAPRKRVTLFKGELPEDHAERKKEKPDLEALTLLPDGRLLAIGSGSKPNRMRGALIAPDDSWSVEPIDLAPLYRLLDTRIEDLNIEGAAVVDGRLFLAQRGNGAAGIHALIELDLAHVLDTLARDFVVSAGALRAIRNVELGKLAEGALGFTDLAPHPSRNVLVFAAAAEASASTYDDGEVTGSAVGVIDLEGGVERCIALSPCCKIEGLAVTEEAGRGALSLLMVADADDRAHPAPLFTALLDVH